ncbi:serine/threonine protein kinase [Pseudolabrys sp. Root1462]|uniref:serine/threonine protein kinase n=1 Tax=Pseudolabrys sp. Root1462 TaxID=1736466 RepID=UPI000703605A|nr:bifunctional serine/threonine-protein kinase/universal stress protein [Pseudolabrys sp. Root1462]KQZ01075.1 serine/threonine protein kinase [Pseudolabrys sp. Root1462]
MVKPLHETGVEIDGFRLEAMVHRGGMAMLWRVSKPGLEGPMLMKVPRIGEGADPAAIVGFEMEQMILPKLNGPHVPKFIAAGDFARQPYLVMEAIDSPSLLKRLPQLPLPYDEVARLGVRIAEALDDLHRQHVVHLDVKPSNILFRSGGEAVLIDFGLSHHDRLPDLMQEEFRVPFGTAPYMSPEQLRGIRNEPRSDLFALGVLLYFFSTGVRPFGESETMRGMRRRLWRDPMPPRALRPDYPPWLQEIVLRCLEVEAGRRHPTAAQLAFDLSHPGEVKLSSRSEKRERDSFTTVMRRRFNTDLTAQRRAPVTEQLTSAPIVAVAVDVGAEAAPVNAALLDVTARMLATLPDARLACLNVLKSSAIAIDSTLDKEGHNKQIDRLVRLKDWAAPLKLDERRLTAHVLEGTDPAAAILDFVTANRVDHVLIGARRDSFRRRVLGSVSAKVATEAACSVTIVRAPRVPLGDA